MPGLRALRILPIMPDQPCIRAKGKGRGKVSKFPFTPRTTKIIIRLHYIFISPKCARSMHVLTMRSFLLLHRTRKLVFNLELNSQKKQISKLQAEAQ